MGEEGKAAFKGGRRQGGLIYLCKLGFRQAQRRRMVPLFREGSVLPDVIRLPYWLLRHSGVSRPLRTFARCSKTQ